MTMLTAIPDELWRWMIVGTFVGLAIWNIYRTGRDK